MVTPTKDFTAEKEGKNQVYFIKGISMTLEELNNRISEIKKKHDIAVNEVRAIYAKSQELYRVGDIITNGSYIVRIVKIGWNLDFNGNPYPIYRGGNLTKKGTINKNTSSAAIYGNEGTKLINIKESA